MKRAFEILSVALFLLLMPVLAAQPLLPRPYVDPFGGMALAVQPDEMLADQALEARARALSAGLRCLVCQNQSIDDSDADLARDLRLLVRERLKAGDSDRAAVDYIVARYGEFVLLKPRFETVTLLLWGTPLVLLLGGAALALGLSRRRSPSAAPRLSEAEERAVEKVLADRGL